MRSATSSFQFPRALEAKSFLSFFERNFLRSTMVDLSCFNPWPSSAIYQKALVEGHMAEFMTKIVTISFQTTVVLEVTR